MQQFVLIKLIKEHRKDEFYLLLWLLFDIIGKVDYISIYQNKNYIVNNYYLKSNCDTIIM